MSQKQPLLDVKPAFYNEPVSGWRRFSKAICVAAVVSTVLGVLMAKTCILTTQPGDYFVDSMPSGPREEDGRVLRCANETWDSQFTQDPFPSYTSQISFYLPVSSRHISLFSRGAYGHGTVRMELSDRSDDQIEVEVTMHYHTLDARDRANVCHLEREKGSEGIGIFTPRRQSGRFPRRYQIKFDTTIRFPRSGSTKSPLVINSLETDMGIWRHDIASLENRVVFRSLSLSGSNSNINADSVSAEYIRAKTSNAAISGSYNVSNSLTFKTSNAPITVTLRMENRDGNSPTHVEMKTSNARLESPITLISTDSDASFSPIPASFSVIAKTSNSPISVTFPEAPSSPFSRLSLSAKTSNAAAHTKLDPTYEGSISLGTSIFSPSLVQKSTPADPSGEGRQRKVDVRKVMRGTLEAGVWWGDDSNKDEGKGTVTVSTSNAFNTLELS